MLNNLFDRWNLLSWSAVSLGLIAFDYYILRNQVSLPKPQLDKRLGGSIYFTCLFLPLLSVFSIKTTSFLTHGAAAFDPFLDSFVALVAYFAVATLFKIPLWVLRSGWKLDRNKSVLLFTGHFFLFPIALIILLIPPRPYRGFERYIIENRSFSSHRIALRLDIYVYKHKRLPNASSVDELVNELNKDEIPKELRTNDIDLRLQVKDLYAAQYSAFDRSIKSDKSYELNWNLRGMRLPLVETDDYHSRKLSVWYLTPPKGSENEDSIVVDLIAGNVESQKRFSE